MQVSDSASPSNPAISNARSATIPNAQLPNASAQPSPESSPDFGLLITTRKPSWLWWLAVPVCGLIGISSLFSGLVLLRPLLGLGGVAHRDQLTSALITLGIGIVATLAAWFGWRQLRTKYDFYERGVIQLRGKKILKTMPYASVRKFTQALTRQYVNGIYAGTTLHINLKDDQGKSITFNGRHKEKSTLLGSTILHKSFKGEDEVDVLRILIAKEMLPYLSQQLATNGGVEWCEKAMISATGVTPARGKLKKTEVPFAQIKGVGTQAGTYHAFREGDKKSFLFLSVNATNFWPGALLFEQLMEQHHMPVEETEIPADAAGDQGE